MYPAFPAIVLHKKEKMSLFFLLLKHMRVAAQLTSRSSKYLLSNGNNGNGRQNSNSNSRLEDWVEYSIDGAFS